MESLGALFNIDNFPPIISLLVRLVPMPNYGNAKCKVVLTYPSNCLRYESLTQIFGI